MEVTVDTMNNDAPTEIVLLDNPFKYLARTIITHCNKIRFLGFEVANMVLIANEIMRGNTNPYGLNWETLATLILICGGACIWQFDAEERPHMLPYGALLIAIGGLLLSSAGYLLMGLATTWSALETARGGLDLVNNRVNRKKIAKQGTVLHSAKLHSAKLHSAKLHSAKLHSAKLHSANSVRLQKHRRILLALLGWYLTLLEILLAPFPRAARILNERPFLVGNASKAPLRLEFIFKKSVVGDWIGAGVGLSWMILGDGALILNDRKLRSSLMKRLSTEKSV